LGAYEYAELIARLLNSFEYLDPRPASPSKIKIPKANPYALYWIDKITIKEEKILTVKEMATFDGDGRMLERNFKYDFRDSGSPDPLFRIDNHGVWQSVSEPCHVHVGREDNLVSFPSSEGKDFKYALHCIKNYYQQRPQDWEKEDDDDPNA
jgi:hypothetical protein